LLIRLAFCAAEWRILHTAVHKSCRLRLNAVNLLLTGEKSEANPLCGSPCRPMTHGPGFSLVALQRYIQQDAVLSVYHSSMTVTSLVFLGILEIRIKLVLGNFEVRDHLDIYT
jgi:hypothetical protein